MSFIVTRESKGVKWGELIPVLWYAISVLIFLWVSLHSFAVVTTSFMSPDERANNFFAHTVAQQGQLHSTELYNGIAFDRVHPRAMESHGGVISHSVFWGMSLIYGLLARAVGFDVVPLVTPLLTIFMSIAVVIIARMHFSRETSWLVASLSLLIPGVLYFSFRAWHNNIAFATLFILSWCGVVYVLQKNLTIFTRRLILLLSGASFGLAVLIRPVEFVWMIPLLLYLYGYFTEMRKTALLLTGCGALAVIGYGVMTWFLRHPSLEIYNTSMILSSGMSLPFGSHASDVVKQVWFYFGKLQWVHALLGLGGLGVVLYYRYVRNVTHEVITQYMRLCAVCLYVMVSQWIAYGIFMFNDTGLGVVSISNSYVRYWLVASIMLLPLIAIALETIKDRYHKWVLVVFSVILSLTAVTSVRVVYRGADGVAAMVTRHVQYDASVNAALVHIPSDAVVLTRTLDKVVFPERKVMSEAWESAQMRESITSLQKAGIRVFALYEVGDTIAAFQKNKEWQEKGSDKEMVFEQIYRDETVILYEIFVGGTQ